MLILFQSIGTLLWSLYGDHLLHKLSRGYVYVLCRHKGLENLPWSWNQCTATDLWQCWLRWAIGLSCVSETFKNMAMGQAIIDPQVMVILNRNLYINHRFLVYLISTHNHMVTFHKWANIPKWQLGFIILRHNYRQCKGYPQNGHVSWDYADLML